MEPVDSDPMSDYPAARTDPRPSAGSGRGACPGDVATHDQQGDRRDAQQSREQELRLPRVADAAIGTIALITHLPYVRPSARSASASTSAGSPSADTVTPGSSSPSGSSVASWLGSREAGM
jgi:hypothetical protein